MDVRHLKAADPHRTVPFLTLPSRSVPRRGPVATAVLAALLATAGCSDGSDDDQAPPGVTAERICDGALDATAAEALKHLGGTDRFTELTGTTDAGQPNAFSVARAAKHLHDNTGLRSRCTVYKAGDKSGQPLVEMDFKAASTVPARQAVENGARDLTYYPLGVLAYAKEENSTSLYFRCPTKGTGSAAAETPYVNAGLFSTPAQIEGDPAGTYRMSVLNSVSRRVADELGCAGDARLPEQVPAGEESGV
ncbi:hypothetical protein [Streptomyces liangshanensis]|uniref:Uncharacterized protein n=1 Tax=Streptomyces liangshanensis TaxID=2717324 RepID=A0A6G9GVR5_9ACTN|nr:hypothetical protein [Streptomyces liangshanensis]QIQ02362.1 hypothetical protein HA039_08615 [Streptomyces liangshanensis]